MPQTDSIPELRRKLAAHALRLGRWFGFAVSRLILAVAIALIVVVALTAVLAFTTWYDMAALRGDTAIGRRLFEMALRRSVSARAEGIDVPGLEDPARIRRGAIIYRAECEACHRAPGVARSPLAHALVPAPADLSTNSPRVRWTPAELFWIVKNGIRMTAMPAWGRMHSDEELWDIVSFVALLPTMTVNEHQQIYAETADAARDVKRQR